jgi:hypothetical protein
MGKESLCGLLSLGDSTSFFLLLAMKEKQKYQKHSHSELFVLSDDATTGGTTENPNKS